MEVRTFEQFCWIFGQNKFQKFTDLSKVLTFRQFGYRIYFTNFKFSTQSFGTVHLSTAKIDCVTVCLLEYFYQSLNSAQLHDPESAKMHLFNH